MTKHVRIWTTEVIALFRNADHNWNQCISACERLGLNYETENSGERISVLTVDEGWTNFATHI